MRGLIRSSPCGGADIKEGDAVRGFEPLAWPCLHAFSCFGIVEACNDMVAAWNSWKATTEAACAPQKRVGESWEDPSVENISTHLKCTDACG